MSRTPVASSNVKSVGYDVQARILEVEFVSGALYQYDAVDDLTFMRLLNAPSIGKAFHALVRGKFAERQVASVTLSPNMQVRLTSEQLDDCRTFIRERARSEYEAHEDYVAKMTDIQERFLVMLKKVGADQIPLAELQRMFINDAFGIQQEGQ